MDIEESKILLKDFQKGKTEKDKLETYKGGYKLGYFYTVGIQEAIETVLSELEKKDKVINEMAIYLADIDFDECCAEIPEPCLSCSWEDYEPHINCIKKYFTNKVEQK